MPGLADQPGLIGKDVAGIQFVVDLLEAELGLRVSVSDGGVFEVQFPVDFAVDDLHGLRGKARQVGESIIRG